jgi:hypothetical protein
MTSNWVMRTPIVSGWPIIVPSRSASAIHRSAPASSPRSIATMARRDVT